MSSKDHLWIYYENELKFLRKFSRQFAEAHPAIAGRLIPDAHHPDPFTDRLIDAIGLLNARTHLKLDTEFAEICANLLEYIAPQSLAPVPAMSVVQFISDLKNSSVNIPRNTVLTSMTPGGEPCYFTTAYDTELHSYHIKKANLNTDILLLPLNILPLYKSSLCIELESLSKINFNHLRFFIRAQPTYAYMLYELLFRHTLKVILSDSLNDQHPVILDKKHLQTDGFDHDQTLLLHHHFQNREQSLLTEFLNCPEKFLFFSLKEIENAYIKKKTGSHSLYIFILFDSVYPQLEKYLTADMLALNCTPVVNIFPALSEPIQINHTQNEYLLKARLNHDPLATEIYGIQEVSACNTEDEKILLRPQHYPAPDSYHFFHARRRANPEPEIYLSFSTQQPDLFYNHQWVATAEILCTNRHFVSHLPYGGNSPLLTFENMHYQHMVSDINLLIPFTPVQDISLEHENLIHRLVSTLSIYQSPLSFLSFRKAINLSAPTLHFEHLFLSHIIHLDYRFSQQRILTGKITPAIIHGIDIYLQIDTEKISSSQAFFFGSILERYFGFQAEINSYTSLVMVNSQQEEIYRWPLRCGESEYHA